MSMAIKKKSDKEAFAISKSIRSSPSKLNFVVNSIRGMKVEKALNVLNFSRRRISQDIKKTLQSAIANAENNKQLDSDNLIIAEAYVGKALLMKRYKPRAKGRPGPIDKHTSRLTVIVREQEVETEKKKFKKEK